MTFALFIIYLLIISVGYWLKYLNLAHMKANAGVVPPEFHGVVDPALLHKMSDYTLETSRVGTIESIIENAVLILLLFGGLIGSYDRWIAPLSGSFIRGGVLFFLVLVFAESVIGIPFRLYKNFKIENRFCFNFEPVKTEGLEAKIRSLMERAGLKVSRVFQVDASRRSRHSNAYFTGIGRVKRIVLFDTLIAQMTHDEILAVLAHEVGHWKKRHVIKRLLMTEILALVGFFLAFRVLQWDGLPRLLGQGQVSFYAGVVLVGFFGSLVMFPLTPLFSYLSRRDEREADRFASDLTGRPQAMASALVKLSRENLSNLHPHPLYAKFYYSHPPVVERIRRLNQSKQ